ncbi:MAG: hypothetical protein OXJ53_09360 [Gammaproteobacteria bacterium]|nr:hypothetical protein [Gammaproteobacteria bacterium]MDE0273787.1 hypothetical protein [Gammaproteobacteria bacterium]
MPDRFDYQSLATRLLRGGVAPRRVRRIVGELQDHAQSLHADAVAEGMDEADAASWAFARLGSEQQVAKEMLARPELRSWSARWPWAVYALMPPLLMAALVVLMVLALGPVIDLYVVHWEWETSPAPLPHAWFMSAVNGTLATFKYVAPLLLCAAFCSMAVLRLSRSPWLIAGIVATAVLGGSFDIYMTWEAELWTTSVNLFLLPPYPDPQAHGLRIAANLLLTLTPYLYWCFHQKRGQPETA